MPRKLNYHWLIMDIPNSNMRLMATFSSHKIMTILRKIKRCKSFSWWICYMWLSIFSGIVEYNCAPIEIWWMEYQIIEMCSLKISDIHWEIISECWYSPSWIRNCSGSWRTWQTGIWENSKTYYAFKMNLKYQN